MPSLDTRQQFYLLPHRTLNTHAALKSRILFREWVLFGYDFLSLSSMQTPLSLLIKKENLKVNESDIYEKSINSNVGMTSTDGDALDYLQLQ